MKKLIFQKIKKIKRFDFFGVQTPLPYNNNFKYNSFFGTFLSFSLLIFGFVLFFYFGKNFMMKENPFLYEIQEIYLEDSQLNFENNEIFFAFTVFSSRYFKSFYNSSIYEISAHIFSVDNTKKIEEQVTFTPLFFEPCSEKNIPKNIIKKHLFSSRQLNSMICLSKKSYNKLSIRRDKMEKFQTIEISFKFCKNNSINICGNESEINDLINFGYVELLLIDKNINPLRYNNPGIDQEIYNDFYFSKKEKNNIELYFEKTKLTTDNGFFLKNENDQFIPILSKVNKELRSNTGNNEFVTISIRLAGNRKKITRIYDKIPKVFAEVGGVLHLLIILFRIVFKPILKLIFMKEVLNKNYYICKKNEDNNNLKNKNLVKKKVNNENFISQNEKFNKQIEIVPTPPIMFKNYFKRKFVKIKTNINEIFKLNFCKKEVKNDKKYDLIRTALNDFISVFEMNYLRKKIQEIDLIKQLLFDKNQRKVIGLVPLFVKENYNCEFQKFDKKNFIEEINKINRKNIKSEIDLKIIKKFIDFT